MAVFFTNMAQGVFIIVGLRVLRKSEMCALIFTDDGLILVTVNAL